jgi:hypothetical protein
MNREDDKPTKLTSGRLSKSMRASAITDQRFKALQTSAIEVMVLSSGRLITGSRQNSCIVADVGTMNHANCKAFSDVKSLTETMMAHDEKAGCSGSGSDYSLFYGTPYSGKTKGGVRRHNYFSNLAMPIFRPCGASLPTQTWNEYQYTSMYLRSEDDEKTSCSQILADQPHSRSGYYIINPDGPGGEPAFEVYCDMTSGGWTLVSQRQDDVPTQVISGTLRRGSHAKAITDAKFKALQRTTTKVKMVNSGPKISCGKKCASCVVADVRAMNAANCKTFASVKSLTETSMAHDEKHGCSATGGDYSLFFGVSAAAGAKRHDYFSDLSSRQLFRTCDDEVAGRPSPRGEQVGEYMFAAMFLQNQVAPKHGDYSGTNSATNTLSNCADKCADQPGCHAFAFGTQAGPSHGRCQLLQSECDSEVDPRLQLYYLPSLVRDKQGVYLLVEAPMTFQQAREFCRMHFFDLASVHTIAQHHTVQQLCLRSGHTGGCHIGVSDDVLDDSKLDLSHGKGGEAGTTVYISGAVTVTSSSPTFNNGKYYNLGYLFDGVARRLDDHLHYWLAAHNRDTTLTIRFRTPTQLTRVRLSPRCRADTSAQDWQLFAGDNAATRVMLSGRVHQPDAKAGQYFDVLVHRVVSALTLQVYWTPKPGGRNPGYMSFAEIELYAPKKAATRAAVRHMRALDWQARVLHLLTQTDTTATVVLVDSGGADAREQAQLAEVLHSRLPLAQVQRLCGRAAVLMQGHATDADAHLWSVPDGQWLLGQSERIQFHAALRRRFLGHRLWERVRPARSLCGGVW